MIEIEITLFPPFSKGNSKEEFTISFEGELTVRDLLKHVAADNENVKKYLGRIFEEEQIRLHVLILHNDHVAHLSRTVHNGDHLKLLHPLQGG